jgi:hypothetical protein
VPCSWLLGCNGDRAIPPSMLLLAALVCNVPAPMVDVPSVGRERLPPTNLHHLRIAVSLMTIFSGSNNRCRFFPCGAIVLAAPRSQILLTGTSTEPPAAPLPPQARCCHGSSCCRIYTLPATIALVYRTGVDVCLGSHHGHAGI